ncbi:hypothetical protein [Streptomyces leeuwenhoekii]|uniref:Peptidase inhibitor family I36 n=1 Tax=Streptomyces leeuwenhoekii TaxID=1437453 RepID=A0A0F7VQK1_STRLW|nr:hypothetical protein [Streptomyces leeuwenhoekii]CQR59722.1 Conserved Hypothetical Protein [Streptomyces leeuwenhoekii]
MTGRIRRALVVALGFATTLVMAVGPAQAKAAAPWANCPDGAVCLYPEGQTPAQSPSHVFWRYGAHNLSGQYNYHWILNNQYGGARAKLCSGYNGTGTCHHHMAPQTGWWTDFTPVNSVVLYLP